MRHGRLADAAVLAAQHLQAALQSVPSVGMARMSQVGVPAWQLSCCAEHPLGAGSPAASLHSCCVADHPPPASCFPTGPPSLPIQVYFPAALLDELVAQLGAGGAGLAAERQQLAGLVQRVRAAALEQTAIIQQVHAV